MNERTGNKYLEPKDEETFLEMCRLAAGQDTGGQWTDEKIDAIEAIELDPRAAVRRLFKMYNEERQAKQEVMSAFERSAAMWRQRVEAAETKWALVDEYGRSQWNSGASGSEFEAGPCQTFDEWLAQREELLQPRA
jgi:hypothetical protein